jgi:hypothetical protein
MSMGLPLIVMLTPLGISQGEVILLIVLIAIPIATLAFILGARNALGQIGKGQFAIDDELPQSRGESTSTSPQAREAEIRQMLEAKAYRQRSRGEQPLDVEAELESLLDTGGGGDLRRDAQLVSEVRQLVIARNERRQRQGKEPLDVEAEIDRQLRELENLGQ